jgi:hypothetical protein
VLHSVVPLGSFVALEDVSAEESARRLAASNIEIREAARRLAARSEEPLRLPEPIVASAGAA